MNILEKLAAAKATQTGKYFDAPGKYRCKVKALKLNEDGFKGPTFVAEMEIVSATDTGTPALKLEGGKLVEFKRELHVIGDERNLVVVLDPKNDSTFSNVKAFLCGLTGLAETEIDVTGIVAAVSKEQPFAGWEIEVDVSQKPQAKDKTKVYTVLKWNNVPRTK